jgi:hypothetical protein
MFKNNLIGEIHETRFIASWLRAGGQLYYVDDVDDFCKWLSSLGLNEDEVYHIRNMATCGKMELEHNAREFLNKHC